MGGEGAINPKLHRGDCFGEIALLYMTPRTRTIRALTDAVVWVFDRSDFKQMMMGSVEDKNEEYVKYLDKIDILDCLATEEKKGLANALVKLRFSKGEFIMKQGDAASAFYILMDGHLSVSVDGEVTRQLSASSGSGAEYFGERALIEQKPRSATVKVESDSVDVLAWTKPASSCYLGLYTKSWKRVSQRMSSYANKEAKRSKERLLTRSNSVIW